jgi:predicted transcriptional regulator
MARDRSCRPHELLNLKYRDVKRKQKGGHGYYEITVNGKTGSRKDARRERILELTSEGFSQRQIASILQISHGTVGNYQIFLRQKAKENIKRYIDERLPEEYEKCLAGITSILREAWTTSYRTDIDTREKIQALSLAKECYSMKLELLTNATVVDDAIKFVSDRSREKLKPASSNSNQSDKEPKEVDYNEDEELEEKQEEQTGEITVAKINQVF